MRIGDPEFWKSVWEEALKSDARRQKNADAPESIERWNNRAQQFAENADAPGTQNKVEELLGWLAQNGALEKGMKVLDIGAGSGKYALPLAKMGCEVTALEPAEVMVSYMRKRVEHETVTNITILNKPWQAVELERDGMLGRFDLVFASMTPGIQRPDDLLKMMEASRRACYLSSHTRGRWHHLEKVFPLVFDREMPDTPGDFLYRFGLVYAMGHVPITRYVKGGGRKGNSSSAEKLKEDILWSLSSYMDPSELTNAALSKIDAYVASINPELEAAGHMSSMAMIWFVD